MFKNKINKIKNLWRWKFSMKIIRILKKLNLKILILKKINLLTS